MTLHPLDYGVVGAAYFVNDFYKRFIVREQSESHYVLVWVFRRMELES